MALLRISSKSSELWILAPILLCPISFLLIVSKSINACLLSFELHFFECRELILWQYFRSIHLRLCCRAEIHAVLECVAHPVDKKKEEEQQLQLQQQQQQRFGILFRLEAPATGAIRSFYSSFARSSIDGLCLVE